MRKLEKGLLCAELFYPECIDPENVARFVKWIREQDCYIRLLESMNRIKKSSSDLAGYLYEEFAAIDLGKISRIEDGLVAYAKILYLCQLATPHFYINPLMALSEEEREIKVGEVLIAFDQKHLTLNQFSESSAYSFREKSEQIREKVRLWENDVYDDTLQLVEKLNDCPRNLPVVRVFSAKRIFIAAADLLMGGIFAASYFAEGSIVREGLFSTSISRMRYDQIFTCLFLIFLGLSVLGFLIELFVRLIRFGHYKRARKNILTRADRWKDRIHSGGQELENYLLRSVEKMTPMNHPVKKYDCCSSFLDEWVYLYRVNFKAKSIGKDKINVFHRIVFSLTVIFFIIWLSCLVIELL